MTDAEKDRILAAATDCDPLQYRSARRGLKRLWEIDKDHGEFDISLAAVMNAADRLLNMESFLRKLE